MWRTLLTVFLPTFMLLTIFAGTAKADAGAAVVLWPGGAPGALGSAPEWGVDPARIGILGFSAGGHLASTLGTHFDAGSAAAADPVGRVSSRPDLLILIYPVITMREMTHAGSKRNLLGTQPTPGLVA